MKIALLIDDSLDKTDGVQQFVLTLGQFLNSKNHEVHYLTSEAQRTDRKYIHTFSSILKVRFNGNLLGISKPVSRRKIKAFLKQHSFDILHVMAPYNPVFAGRFIKAFKDQPTKVICHFHILPYKKIHYLGTYLSRLISLGSLSQVDSFMANTENVSQFFARVYKIKINRIIPNLIDNQTFHEAHPIFRIKDKINLVFLGRLVARKGIINLIKALQLLPPHLLKDLHFHIGGQGVLESKIKMMIAQTELEAMTTMHGFIPENKKANFLASADIAIFPALGGESFGIVLVEAMASGVLVLAGHNLGYDSVLGHHPDLMFDASSAQATADCLKKWLLASSTERSEQAQALKKEALKYDPDLGCGSDFLELYQSLL